MDKEEQSQSLLQEWPDKKQPVITQTKVEPFKAPPTNDLVVEDFYDSNLSNLYDKIMKGHNTDFIKNSPLTGQVKQTEEHKMPQ